MVGRREAVESKPSVSEQIFDAEVVEDEKATGGKATSEKSKKATKPKAGKAELARSGDKAQLNVEQQAVFETLRAGILEAKKDKGLEFLIRVGGLIVDAIGEGEGDDLAVDQNHAVLKALGKDESVKVSQSSLWYATQLVDQGKLFGDAAPHLSASHKRRLLHAPADQRHALAAQIVKDNLTVVQSEKLIKDKKKKPVVDGNGKGPRGARPLSDAAKFFSPLSSAVENFNNLASVDVKGLSAKKAETFYHNAQLLKKLVAEWLPSFEAELRKLAKIES